MNGNTALTHILTPTTPAAVGCYYINAVEAG